jgi:CMP-N-acetylneuraminic acid synthetase
MTLAIITARGGSKRLPRKNILSFCGHPLLAWTMKQAQCSKYVDGVIVTTDDNEIFWIANKYADEKTHVMMRPEWEDDTASNKAFYHAVQHVEQLHRNRNGRDMGITKIVALFPTSPVRYLDDIDNTILLSEKWRDSVIGWYGPERETFIYENIGTEGKYYKPVIRNKSFKYSHMASGTWVGARKVMMEKWKESFSDKYLDAHLDDDMSEVIGYQVKPWQCFECDYQEWFDINEMIMENFILQGRGIEIYDRS